MKHNTFLAAAVIIALLFVLSLVSCKKQPPEHCWECDVKQKTGHWVKYADCGETPKIWTDGHGNDLEFQCKDVWK